MPQSDVKVSPTVTAPDRENLPEIRGFRAYTPGMSEQRADSSPLDSPELSGSTLTEERSVPMLDEGDHERLAHYVRKEKILESAMTGEPVIALCGKVWIPNRDPAKFPVCPDCQAIYEGLPVGDDKNQNGSTP